MVLLQHEFSLRILQYLKALLAFSQHHKIYIIYNASNNVSQFLYYYNYTTQHGRIIDNIRPRTYIIYGRAVGAVGPFQSLGEAHAIAHDRY